MCTHFPVLCQHYFTAHLWFTYQYNIFCIELTTFVSDDIPPSTIVAKSGCEIRSFIVSLKHLLHTRDLFFWPNCSGRLAMRPQQSLQNSPPHLRQWCLYKSLAWNNKMVKITAKIMRNLCSPSVQQCEMSLTCGAGCSGLIRDPLHASSCFCSHGMMGLCSLRDQEGSEFSAEVRRRPVNNL